MQHSPNEITEKLLKALDKDYNVVDVPVVVEIIGILERTPITKEALETTRLGKYVNELRRKTTNEQVAKRAKDLVRKWRDLILPQNNAGGEGGAGSNQNGARPPISSGRIVSPSIGRSISPGSWSKSGPISPALSLKRSQPSSPASRISSLSPDNRVNLSPNSQRQMTISSNISPRPQLSISKLNQPVQLPRPIGETSSGNQSSALSKIPDQSTSGGAPRPRGRPPLNRSGLDVIKSPPRPRGRPPLDHSDGEPPRGRGRPPLDPTKSEHRGRGRPPLSSPPTGVYRGRGRPPKNKNKLKKFPSSPESNQNNNLVPKNSPANKRLRKPSEEEEDDDDDGDGESASKKLKLNGVYDSKVPESVVSNEETAISDQSQVPREQIKIQKKRGRKKGSKNAPKKYPFERSEEDVVKEKMASIVRNPKVKTTRELLECIQKETSLDNLRNKTLSSLGVDGDKAKTLAPSPKFINKNEISDYEMTLSKSEHIHKFLRSQREAEEEYDGRSVKVAEHKTIKLDRITDERAVSRIDEATAIGKTEESSAKLLSSSSLSPPLLPPPPPLHPQPQPPQSQPQPQDNLDQVEEDVIDVEKIDSATEDSPVKSKMPETVEEILAKLPAINPDDINWSDSGDSGESDSEGREVTDYDVDCLHNDHIEGINGNWNDGALVPGLRHGLKLPIGEVISNGDIGEKPNDKPNMRTDGDEIEHLDRNLINLDVNDKSHDDNFREWQECVSKKSYNGELLHILPYVIID